MYKDIIEKYLAGIDPVSPLLDISKCEVSIFKMREVSRKIKKSKYFWINWYRKLLNKEKWDIDYVYEYTTPKKD